MSKLTLGMIFGVCSILAVIGVGAVIDWTINYQSPIQAKTITVANTYPEIDSSISGASSLIGKHVKLREGWAIKFPANTEGVIVAVPGSDDWCGHQDGTSVRWIDFPSKDPSCHWMSELEIE